MHYDSTTIAGGIAHTCVVRWDGQVGCWGDNGVGQLGNGSQLPSPVPVAVPIGNATAVTAGGKHTCALLADGRVQCWGDNSEGQLGNGTNNMSTVPVFVGPPGGSLQNVIAINAGDRHTCAIRSTGAVYCWGAGGSGQLGNGFSLNRNVPVQAVGITTAATVAGGGEHSCVSTTGGDVYCWGRGGSGELGDGNTVDRNVPVLAAVDTDFVEQITAGRAHTCALLQDHTMECWGDNTFGQLAMTPGGSSALPVAIPQGTYGRFRTAVTAGDDFTCALGTNGENACWGLDMNGQLGRGNVAAPPPDHQLAAVDGVLNVVGIGAGTTHGCVQRADGSIQCWGANAGGQLGDGTTIPRDTPALVPGTGAGLRGDVAAGTKHTCALRFDGTVKCWGHNGNGQLGLGHFNDTSVPLQIPDFGTVEALEAGSAHTCALLSNGDIHCWGLNSTYQLGNVVNNIDSNDPVRAAQSSRYVAMAAGEGHTCGLRSGGGVRCWGDNARGQLGDGTTGAPKPVYVTPSGLIDAIAIDAGFQHTCAIRANGVVVCWGANSSGQLGVNFPNDAATPQTVPLPAAATELGLGAYHSCAVLVNGTVACWGANDTGQAAPGGPMIRETPFLIGGIDTAEEVAGAQNHSCALLANGTVRCWGSDSNGQIGDGAPVGGVVGPTTVTGLTNINHLELGGGSSHVIRGNGLLAAWGANNQGQLGDSTMTDAPAPVTTVAFP